MSDIAVRVDGLGKQYRLGKQNEKYRTFRDTVAAGLSAPLRALKAKSGDKDKADETFWALKDVSFEVKRGEVVGIIGRNGAGKSTLLKILSRITEPTTGTIDIYGRVGSLLEVGTGFHPELSGRENVFLNGAILGMSKRDIERKFDEIVAFAEVEKFIDTAVKHYSSGMYLRLAFAVAAYLEPEILVVDEVLAVGDAAFQKKCLGKMQDVAGQGRTVLFVSHNMSAVTGLCRRCVWLSQGCIVRDGDVHEVIQQYMISQMENSFSYESPTHGLTIQRVTTNKHGRETSQFAPGDELTVEVQYHAATTLVNPLFYFTVIGTSGWCFSANMLLDGCQIGKMHGAGKISCSFLNIPLLPQSYLIRMAIRDNDTRTTLLSPQEVAGFEVIANMRDYGLNGERMAALVQTSCPVVLPYTWVMPDGSEATVDITRLGSLKTRTVREINEQTYAYRSDCR